jgi:DNA repair photolyase
MNNLNDKTMSTIIYEPSGKAREYSELAANFYTGCSHACKYCYCPAIMRKSLKEWSESAHARTNIIKQFERDAKTATHEQKQKELLFSFMSDCYQNEEAAFLTRQALLIAEQNGFKKVNILTKAGFRAVKDFDIFQRNSSWKFGSTIIMRSEELREQWEPGAPSVQSRYEAVKIAHEKGIFTWVSIEPVVNTDEALNVITDIHQYVDFWKVGKLNHMKEIEDTINWKQFLIDARRALIGKKYLIKKDLLKFQ